MRRLCTVVAIIPLLAGSAAMQQSGKQIIPSPNPATPYSQAIRAGGFVHVSGTLAGDFSGDIKAQTRDVFKRIEEVLKQAGSSLARAASVTVYLKNASDFAAMNEVFAEVFPSDPPARSTVMANLVRPDALVEIAVTAIPDGSPREVILPSGWVRPTSPYNYGIKSGDTLFLSGLVSRNGRDNSVVSGDVATQVKTIMDNAGEILAAAGMSMSDVVSSRVYLKDVQQFQDMNKAYQAYFPKDPPSRATVRTGLPGTYDVEVTMVAVGGAREAITAPQADGSPGRANPNFSSAIRVGNRLFVSGMLGATDANKGDMKAQAAETLVRLGRALQAAGFQWTDVVESTVYITDVKNFQAMNEAYTAVFKSDRPTRATIEAGLVSPDGLVEIALWATK